MPDIGNWTVENCSTTGTGDLILTGAAASHYTTFADTVDTGEVWYVIKDGDDRESGKGTFNGTTTVTRDTIYATLVSGVFDDTSPTAISLSGSATVASSFTKQAFDSLKEVSTDGSFQGDGSPDNVLTLNGGRIYVQATEPTPVNNGDIWIPT